MTVAVVGVRTPTSVRPPVVARPRRAGGPSTAVVVYGSDARRHRWPAATFLVTGLLDRRPVPRRAVDVPGQHWARGRICVRWSRDSSRRARSGRRSRDGGHTAAGRRRAVHYLHARPVLTIRTRWRCGCHLHESWTRRLAATNSVCSVGRPIAGAATRLQVTASRPAPTSSSGCGAERLRCASSVGIQAGPGLDDPRSPALLQPAIAGWPPRCACGGRVRSARDPVPPPIRS